MFKDSAAARALVTYLAEACGGDDRGQVRAGLLVAEQERPSQRLHRPAQPGDGDRAGSHAKTFRFDLSDLAPSAFGGTVGQGTFKLFQDFLKTPSDVNGIAAQDGGGREGGLQVSRG